MPFSQISRNFSSNTSDRNATVLWKIRIMKFLFIVCVLSTILELCLCQSIWHSNHVDFPKDTRNDFALKNVTVDGKFNIELDVKFWKSLSTRNIAYAVGVAERKIIVLKATKNEKFKVETHIHEIGTTILDLTISEIYNPRNGSHDFSMIAVSNDGTFKYFSLEKLQLLWSWNLGFEANQVKVVSNTVSKKQQIYIATNHEILVYDFDVPKQKLWLAEKLHFEDQVGIFDVASYKTQFYLLVPEKGSSKLRMFEFSDGHFQTYKNISVEEVDQVVVFQENFDTFFAVNGPRAGIYRFERRNNIMKERISNSVLEGITYWLPIETDIIDRKLILLAQRTLEHGSHKSLVIDTFLYKDKQFEEHDDIPCYVFGEKLNTLSCLSNTENGLGIEGATHLAVGNTLVLLLARKNHHMFNVNFESKLVESPVQKEMRILTDTKIKLQKLLDERKTTIIEKSNQDTTKKVVVDFTETDSIKTRASFSEERTVSIPEKPTKINHLKPRNNVDLAEKLNGMLESLKEMKAKMDSIENREKSGNFTRITINGQSQIGQANAVELMAASLNDNEVHNTLNDIVRKNSNRSIEGTKTFSDLVVENLNFGSVNGIENEDIVHKSPGVLLNGDIIFEKPLVVLEDTRTVSINGLPSEGIIHANKPYAGILHFENIQVTNLQTEEMNKLQLPDNLSQNENLQLEIFEKDVVYIPHNVTVVRVNGEDFETVKRELCLVNIETFLRGSITINGDIVVDEPSDTQFLNKIRFPQDYIFTNNGSSGIVITGKKNFTESLIGNEIRTNDRLINDMRTSDFFTLSTEQNISSRALFSDLKITGELKHDGKTMGDHIGKFLPNPTLRESKLIKSNVNFEGDVEVTGSIIIDDDLDSKDFHNLLEDVIYKDVGEAKINALKEFPDGLTVRKLKITSNAINQIPVDEFVTTDTDQILNISQLNGNVSIDAMEVYQLIEGLNITKLEQETVKIFGEQFVSSILIFDEVEANKLEIIDELNEVSVGDYLYTSEDFEINRDASFHEITAQNLIVKKDFNGDLLGIDLESFFENRMSYTKNQSFSEQFSLENMEIMSVDCNFMKDMEYCEELFGGSKFGAITDRINSGLLIVKDLIVNDDLIIEQVDGTLLDDVEKLKEKILTIHGEVYFSNVKFNKLSEVNFQKFLDNIILKNEKNVTVFGTKIFQKGFDVESLIETKKLNFVPISNLFTKEGDQAVDAPIEISGNVVFKNDLTVLESINGISMEFLKDYFKMNDDIYVINGSITFDRLSHIYNLEIMENLNEKNVRGLLDNIAWKSEELSLPEDIVFLEQVSVDGNIELDGLLNDIDLSDTEENIVLIDDVHNVESMVTFLDPHIFAHNLTIEQSLNSKTIYRMDLKKWIDDAVYVNQGLLKGVYNFEDVVIHDRLYAKIMNNVCMNSTIHLGTKEDIDTLTFKNVILLNNVSVGGSVNLFNLTEEYSNSVLGDVEQEILSSLSFTNNTLIRDNLKIAGLVNGYPTNKIVTTNTDQNLTASYHFPSKVVLESDLNVAGDVNDINMTIWENGAVKVISQDPQEIIAPWHVTGNITFQESVDGNNTIMGFDMGDVSHKMLENKKSIQTMEEAFERDHKNICVDLRSLSKGMKKQIYKFETFEELQTLHLPEDIGKAIFFSASNPILLINGKNSCNSSIFLLQNDVFVKVSEITVGNIDQAIHVPDGEKSYLVINTLPNRDCDIEGTDIWIYADSKVKKLQKVDNQLQLQESKMPLTFYGMNKDGVTEFKIDVKKAVPVYPYRKWLMRDDNMAFVPRGLKTGLAISTGQNFFELMRNDPIMDNDVGFGDIFIRGTTKLQENNILPGRNNSMLAVITAGPTFMRKTLLAVVFNEETVVDTNSDVIKIYEDHSDEKVFQKLPTQNPTSLLSLEFESGETFLIVLENEEKLKIYQYKGNEGFRFYSQADIQGSHMFKMDLPSRPDTDLSHLIGVLNKNMLTIIKPVMMGKPVSGIEEC